MASHTVSAHQLSAYASPVAGQDGTASVVLGNDNTTVTGYNSHDSDPTIHVQDSIAGDRPAAATAGRKWIDSDTLRAYFDTGSVWAELKYLPLGAGGTVTGNTAVIGTFTASGAVGLGSTLNGQTIGSATTFTGTVRAGTTIGAGAAPAASGAGVTFLASQSASTDANTLDDYEEGTWTPSIGGSATYTTQLGTYVKMGRLVYCAFKLTINAIGTGSASLVSGLPFTEGSGTGGIMSGNLGFFDSLARSVIHITPQVAAGGTVLSFGDLLAAGGSLNNQTNVLQNAARVEGFVIYYANA